MHARCLAASVVVLLALSTPASSQTAASRAVNPDAGPEANPEANPVAWLTSHLGGAACVVYDAGPSLQRLEQVSENTEVRFEGCRMVLQQSSAIGTYGELRTFNVALATLDANAVTASDGFYLPAGWTSKGDVPTQTIHLTVPPGQPLIEATVERFDDVPTGSFQTRTVDILVRHQENATQIVRALTLAIAACRQSHPPVTLPRR
jgi:hypothetical protein